MMQMYISLPLEGRSITWSARCPLFVPSHLVPSHPAPLTPSGLQQFPHSSKHRAGEARLCPHECNVNRDQARRAGRLDDRALCGTSGPNSIYKVWPRNHLSLASLGAGVTLGPLYFRTTVVTNRLNLVGLKKLGSFWPPVLQVYCLSARATKPVEGSGLSAWSHFLAVCLKPNKFKRRKYLGDTWDP